MLAYNSSQMLFACRDRSEVFFLSFSAGQGLDLGTLQGAPQKRYWVNNRFYFKFFPKEFLKQFQC